MLCLLGTGLVRTAAAEVTAPFPDGARNVQLPRRDTAYRLYLRASSTEAARLRVTVMAGLAHPIGQFRLTPASGEGSPDWIPLTDAAGVPVVLVPHGTSFGAQVTFGLSGEGATGARLLELKAVTTSEEASRAYVAWATPAPGSFGADPGGPLVVEIAPGRDPVTTTVFALDGRVPSPAPQAVRNTLGGLALTHPVPPGSKVLEDGRHAAIVEFRDRKGTITFSWGFHVGDVPGVFATPSAHGGLDIHFVGSLEAAPGAHGPFVPVADAVSPHRINAQDLLTAGYFRAVR